MADRCRIQSMADSSRSKLSSAWRLREKQKFLGRKSQGSLLMDALLVCVARPMSLPNSATARSGKISCFLPVWPRRFLGWDCLKIFPKRVSSNKLTPTIEMETGFPVVRTGCGISSDRQRTWVVLVGKPTNPP